MKISVVIPLYNKEKHIQRAINSVFSQTYKKFELIIVDDGSTDGSFEAASTIQDPRIRIIRQENRGVSAARNRGIMEAKSEWVAFLDADDEWLPGFLEEIWGLIEKYPDCTVAGTAYYLVDNKDQFRLNKIGLPINIGWDGYLDYFTAAVNGDSPLTSSSFAAEKRSLLSAGLYPEGVAISEDTALFMKLAINNKIAYSNTAQSIYHREVSNRTWQGYRDEELYATKQGKDLLTDPGLDLTVKDMLYEYLVRSELGRVRALLYRRKRQEAKDILSYCQNSKRSKDEITKLSRWIKRPKFTYRLLYAFKDRLKGLISALDNIV